MLPLLKCRLEEVFEAVSGEEYRGYKGGTGSERARLVFFAHQWLMTLHAAMERRIRSGCTSVFGKRCDCVLHLWEHLKYCQEFCNLKRFVCMTTDAGKFDRTTDFPGRKVQGDECAQPPAVDVSNAA
jgi:hypothetical protein